MGLFKNLFGCAAKTAHTNAASDAAEETAACADEKTAESEADVIRPLLAFLKGMAESLATERIETLTLREAVTRMVEGRPELECAAKGALVVVPHREGRQVFWTYLDSANQIVRLADGSLAGKKAICTSIDDELSVVLGGRELLILE